MTRARDVANVLTAANVLSTDIETAAAITAHTGITDPHPAYLQESTFSANQIVYKNASNEATGSANLTFSGSDLAVAGTIRSTASAGDEGGEIFLNKSATNTTLNGGVTVDVWQNRLRFFEQGGTARGYYLDIASGGTSVGTNLGSSGGMTSIATGSLSGSSVTISSIPNTYIDLVLYIRGISYQNGVAGRTYVRINGNSDASYRTYMHNYSNVTNVILGGATNWYLVNADTDGSASAHATLRFPDYSVSSNSKHFQGQLTTTYSDSVSYLFHGVHSTITDAISSITILTPINTFDAGTYVLYGVK
jgi:hypothetical protein